MRESEPERESESQKRSSNCSIFSLPWFFSEKKLFSKSNAVTTNFILYRHHFPSLLFSFYFSSYFSSCKKENTHLGSIMCVLYLCKVAKLILLQANYFSLTDWSTLSLSLSIYHIYDLVVSNEKGRAKWKLYLLCFVFRLLSPYSQFIKEKDLELYAQCLWKWLLFLKSPLKIFLLMLLFKTGRIMQKLFPLFLQRLMVSSSLY